MIEVAPGPPPASPGLEGAHGALLGLAVGDALGAPLEGSPREVAAAAVGRGLEMSGGGGWAPGEWTDDTAMALMLAECVGERGRPLDLDDLARRYAEWAAGRPKGIGRTTRGALAGAVSAETARANAHAQHERTGLTAGNGTVMRVAPLAFAPAPRAEILSTARDDARLTHWDPVAGDASAALCAALLAVVAGDDACAAALAEAGDHAKLSGALRLAAAGDAEAVGELAGGSEGGSCWATLATGLCALRLEDYERGVGWAISHGFDTDTNAAVAGALLGCRDGAQAIPNRWAGAVRERSRIEAAARALARG